VTSALVAAAVSGAVGAVGWLLTGLLIRAFSARAEGLDQLGAGLLGAIVALVTLVVLPLLAGLSGGLLSRRFADVIGSMAGFIAAVLVIATVIGGRSPSLEGSVPAAVILGVLVSAGHVTGVAIRPRLRSA
jgi:hypothetical protein